MEKDDERRKGYGGEIAGEVMEEGESEGEEGR